MKVKQIGGREEGQAMEDPDFWRTARMQWYRWNMGVHQVERDDYKTGGEKQQFNLDQFKNNCVLSISRKESPYSQLV